MCDSFYLTPYLTLNNYFNYKITDLSLLNSSLQSMQIHVPHNVQFQILNSRINALIRASHRPLEGFQRFLYSSSSIPQMPNISRKFMNLNSGVGGCLNLRISAESFSISKMVLLAEISVLCGKILLILNGYRA